MIRIDGARAYLNRRGRLLEQKKQGDRGAYIVTTHRIVFGWGMITDDAWPLAFAITDLDTENPEPPGIDAHARMDREDVYFQSTLGTRPNIALDVACCSRLPFQ